VAALPRPRATVASACWLSAWPSYTEADIEAARVDPVGYREHVSALEATSAALASHIDRAQVRRQAEPRTLPFTSDVDLLGDFDGVIDLDAKHVPSHSLQDHLLAR
jgi:hypothetical protein